MLVHSMFQSIDLFVGRRTDEAKEHSALPKELTTLPAKGLASGI
tara:strand:+ start:473 stop:604 length:132 start_codon:yes stop_codon:yes gene_type:complete